MAWGIQCNYLKVPTKRFSLPEENGKCILNGFAAPLVQDSPSLGVAIDGIGNEFKQLVFNWGMIWWATESECLGSSDSIQAAGLLSNPVTDQACHRLITHGFLLHEATLPWFRWRCQDYVFMSEGFVERGRDVWIWTSTVGLRDKGLPRVHLWRVQPYWGEDCLDS